MATSDLKAIVLQLAKKYQWHKLGEPCRRKTVHSAAAVTAAVTSKKGTTGKDRDILDLTQSFADTLTVDDDDDDNDTDDSDDELFRRKQPTKKVKKTTGTKPTKTAENHPTTGQSSSTSSSPDDRTAFKPNTKSKKLLEQRNSITDKLYRKYNELAFGGELPPDLPIVWSKRLTSTAGLTKMSFQTSTGTRQGEIVLSEKVVDDVFRLKSTLLHEMCHAAAWFIDGTRKPPHGQSFWKWASICSANIPGAVVTTCHSYQIHKPFQFECVDCHTKYGRHSKSIDVKKHCCGVCKGKLEFVGTFNSDGTVSTPAFHGLLLRSFSACGHYHAHLSISIFSFSSLPHSSCCTCFCSRSDHGEDFLLTSLTNTAVIYVFIII